MAETPMTLGSGGAALWLAITEDHDLDAAQLVQLEEACRIKDRCDALDLAVRTLQNEGDLKDYMSAVDKANASANQMKQLIAALRLPDEHGKRPQYRGPRGAQAPTVAGGRVSSMERARQRKSG